MKIIVNKNYVLFDVNTKVNKREFKATPLEFTFSEEYDGLTCKCVFSKIPATSEEEITFYQQPIIDNKCFIPYEVMDGEGILIGVYGYSVDGEELLLRYSPKPKNLWFLEGSYYEGAETPEEILPSQFEQYVAYLNSQIERLDQIKIETEEVSDGVIISITNSDGVTSTTEIYNGEQGPQGEPGKEQEIDNSTITKNEDDELQAVGVKDVKTTNTDKFWSGTLSEYNALVSNNQIDSNTFYNITDDYEGNGVPTGGTTGQVLAKRTNNDYDTEWSSLHNFSHETWTFTLDDDTIVTKEVTLW